MKYLLCCTLFITFFKLGCTDNKYELRRVHYNSCFLVKADSQYTISGIANILNIALSSINLLDEDYDALSDQRRNRDDLRWIRTATRVLNKRTGKNWNSYYDRAKYLDRKYGEAAY